MLSQDMLETPSVEIVYSGLSRTEYSWAELQERPFPPGVDPARIEQYLSISTFQVIPSPCTHVFSPKAFSVRSYIENLI